jgi:Ser/Thr protein kinase RdoA (MazF antagonist)
VTPEERARAALGLAGPLELLRASGGVVFRHASGIVRVGGPAAMAEWAVALADAGVPVARPLAAVGDVSLWEDLPAGPPDFAAMGRTLRLLHERGRDVPALAPFDPGAWLEERVARAPADVAAALRLRLPALPPGETLLHTDAHAGNFRCAGGVATLIDLEQLATGPALYDLTPVEVTERRFRGDRAAFAELCAAYGADPEDPALPLLIAIRETLAVAFVCGLGQFAPARRRLAELDSPTARWQPY